METKTYCIYIHKNKINNKIYVGQTCQKPEYRQNHGEGYKNCSLFYKAIQKYGQDNFEHIILETNLTQEEANQKEEFYIKKYNSMDSDFGYNLKSGGDNHQIFSDLTKEKNRIHAIQLWQQSEHKEKMSEIMKEKQKDPEYRKKQEEYRKEHPHTISEEGKKRISEARKKYIAEHGTPTQGKGHTDKTKKIISEKMKGANNPMYGKHHTEEQKQKMSEKSSIPIQCIETNQIFKSMKEAAQQCGLKSSTVFSDYFAGRKKSAGHHPITKEKLHQKKIEKEN